MGSYVYLPPEWSFKDCYRLKYCNVQKRGSRFTLGLDTSENTDYIQKCLLLSIEFCTKKSVGTYVLFPLEWSYGAIQIAIF